MSFIHEYFPGTVVFMTTAAHDPPIPIRALIAVGLLRGAVQRNGNVERPRQLLELYAFEGCPFCKKVRQRLSALGIDYIHRSAPWGADETRAEVKRRGGKVQFPFLIDPNSGVELYESNAIVEYLDKTYGEGATVTPAPRDVP